MPRLFVQGRLCCRPARAGLRAAVGQVIRACLLGLALAPAVAAGTLIRETLPAGSEPGSRARDFALYVPEGLPSDGSAPLVTILHGCKQTNQDMIDQSGFVELADAEGFAVLFPFVTSWPLAESRNTNCWGFWYESEREEGAGEISDIRRLIAAAEARLGTDPDRRYVAGISSGGAMSVIAAVAYAEDIAAAGAVAGLPYAEAPTAVTELCSLPPVAKGAEAAIAAMAAEQAAPGERRMVPLMIIHSINDCKVNISNAEALRDSWIGYHGARPDPVLDRSCAADGVSCRQRRHVSPRGATVVESLFYNGETISQTHYWPGDGEGAFANPLGPSASALLWAFFRDKSLSDPADLDLLPTATLAGNALTLTGQVPAGIVGLEVALEGDAPLPAQAITPDAQGRWTARFEGLAPDSAYAPVLRARAADGRIVARTGDPVRIGEPMRILEEIDSYAGHAFSGRIGIPVADCGDAFGGVCDESGFRLLLEHGVAPFALYRAEGSLGWYSDSGAIPVRR